MPEALLYKIIVEVEVKEKIGSFYVPEQSAFKDRDAAQIGTVRYMGPHAYTNMKCGTYEKPPIEVGDKVIFARYVGTILDVIDKEGIKHSYRVLTEDHIDMKWFDEDGNLAEVL